MNTMRRLARRNAAGVVSLPDRKRPSWKSACSEPRDRRTAADHELPVRDAATLRHNTAAADISQPTFGLNIRELAKAPCAKPGDLSGPEIRKDKDRCPPNPFCVALVRRNFARGPALLLPGTPAAKLLDRW